MNSNNFCFKNSDNKLINALNCHEKNTKTFLFKHIFHFFEE